MFWKVKEVIVHAKDDCADSAVDDNFGLIDVCSEDENDSEDVQICSVERFDVSRVVGTLSV